MGKKLHPKYINIDNFDFPLPDERIAQFPLKSRDSSKLLISKKGEISQDIFKNLANYLPAESTIIFNETRVIHARLHFTKESGSRIEIFCLEPLAPYRDQQLALQQTGETEWLCLVGNSKRWKNDSILHQSESNGNQVIITAKRIEKLENGTSRIRFNWEPSYLTFAEMLEQAGQIPLPPYIQRQSEASDDVTYQTVYARSDGSVAAPTAGLHFTDNVLKSLKGKNIAMLKFVLHVGAGTFKPVSSMLLQGHEMHAEQVNLDLRTLQSLKDALDKPVTAVGTTSVRLLESLYWHGVKVIKGLSEGHFMDVRQWDPYDKLKKSGISREDALQAVISSCEKSGHKILQGNTSLLIAPGYQFRYPDILITNFHQPRSTLLLLIAAFIGEDWKKNYQYALDQNFRFLSYGDSCLFFKI